MAFISLLFVMMIFGVAALLMVAALVATEVGLAICSAIFLALGIVMFVIAKKRFKQGKRRVPFLPIGIVSTVISGTCGTICMVIIGIIIGIICTPNSKYVDCVAINEKGYQSETFTVNGHKYLSVSKINFNNNAYINSEKAVFSYKTKTPITWGNYFQLEGAGKELNFDIVKGQYNDWFVREDQFNQVVSYYSDNITDSKNLFLFDSSSNSPISKEYSDFLNLHINELINSYYTNEDIVELKTYNIGLREELIVRTLDNYYDRAYIDLAYSEGNWYLHDSNYYKLSSGFTPILNSIANIQ